MKHENVYLVWCFFFVVMHACCTCLVCSSLLCVICRNKVQLLQMSSINLDKASIISDHLWEDIGWSINA